MKTALFNIHDLVLLLAAAECCILALFFIARPGAKAGSRLLLAAFLVLNALIALHIVILWGKVRYAVFDISPNIFFQFSFAYFLQGPVLYWYTKSLLYRDFHFRPIDTLHLLPSLATPVFLYIFYYRRPLDIQRTVALDFKNYGLYEWNFNYLVHAEKVVVVVYGALCLYQLLRFRATLKDNYSNPERIDFTWLLLLIGGFLLVWGWFFVTHVVGLYMPLNISDFMGVLGTYLIFVLINALVVYSLIYMDAFEGVDADSMRYRAGERESINPQHVGRIRCVMESERLFLNSRLTLDDFANAVGLPARVVSLAINRGIGQNFQEFVNHYRVEEARRILAAPVAEQAMPDVASMAGFNSRATFNRFFKKYTSLTPSQYREKQYRRPARD